MYEGSGFKVSEIYKLNFTLYFQDEVVHNKPSENCFRYGLIFRNILGQTRLYCNIENKIYGGISLWI